MAQKREQWEEKVREVISIQDTKQLTAQRQADESAGEERVGG
jgi:hypothetical protein